MKTTIAIATSAAAALLATAAMAAPATTPGAAPASAPAPVAVPVVAPGTDEALKVSNYYFDGKDAGPLLLKTIACLKVDEAAGSKTKNECVQPVSGPVPKGSQIQAWTQWLVPVGAKYDDVTIQFLLDGAVRETKDLELAESLRMRTWRLATASKAGKWTIKVQRAGKDLASVDFEVK